MTPAQVAHIMPPLPKPLTLSRGDEDGAIQLGYTAEQMQAYARAAVEAALRDAPQAEPSDPEDCPAWCPRCDGTGDEVQMSDSSPDAHEVTVNCRHCDGVGTLYAAYTGVVRELAKKHQAYIKACGEIYFSKLKTPSAPTALEPDCAGGMPCTDCPNRRKCQAGCIKQGEALERPNRKDLSAECDAGRLMFERRMLDFGWRNFTGEVMGTPPCWYYANSDLNARWIGWREACAAILAANGGKL